MARSKRKNEDQPEEVKTSEGMDLVADDSQSIEQQAPSNRPGWAAAGLAALVLFFVLAFLF